MLNVLWITMYFIGIVVVGTVVTELIVRLINRV